MLYSNRYPSRGNYTSLRSNPTNYTLRVMPYDEDLREDFIDLAQPSMSFYLLIAIIVILFLLYYMDQNVRR